MTALLFTAQQNTIFLELFTFFWQFAWIHSIKSSESDDNRFYVKKIEQVEVIADNISMSYLNTNYAGIH